MSTPLRIITDHLTGTAPLDTAVSRALLQRVSDGDLPEMLQVGRPHKVVAFGKHDALTDGFEHAVEIAIGHGFDPTIRIAGGRAVVFHPQTVRFAWTVPCADPITGMHDRFATVANHVVAALGSLGVSASVGELDREYCPGKYSVYLEDAGKIMGSGQRLAKRAAQVAGMIVVRDADVINEVLVPVYATLGLDMDPARTGAIAAAEDLDASTVAQSFARLFAEGRDVEQADIDDPTMALARQLQSDHDPRILA